MWQKKKKKKDIYIYIYIQESCAIAFFLLHTNIEQNLSLKKIKIKTSYKSVCLLDYVKRVISL